MTSSHNYDEKKFTSHDGLRLYYRDYNKSHSDKIPLLCLHGLTRNSKDFDRFAQNFMKDHRIYSLDMRGRGQSDYDPNYMNYQIPTYVQDVMAFLEYEDISQVIAIGTSMGGLISMALGAIKPELLKAIILNDVGPEIDPRGIERISQYVGNATIFENWQQAINGVKVISGPLFPDYTHDQWDHFARNTFRENDDGTITADYDPKIGAAIQESADKAVPVDLWPIFKTLSSIPILTLRGEGSDILSPETVAKMADIHPKFKYATITNRAHTPDLYEEASVRIIRNFINTL